mgnify:CR=1 FL=1
MFMIEEFYHLFMIEEFYHLFMIEELYYLFMTTDNETIWKKVRRLKQDLRKV